jgi:hypothetical protein
MVINKKILLDYAVKNGFYDRNSYVEKNSPDYVYVQNIEKLSSDACQQSAKQFEKKHTSPVPNPSKRYGR